MLDPHRFFSFSQELLQGLQIDPSAPRDAWVISLLRATREMTGAVVAYLGIESEQGWTRHGWAGEALVSREDPDRDALGTQVARDGSAWLEPRLRRGSAFDDALDGWPGLSAAGYAAAALPAGASRRGWLACLRTRDGAAFDASTVIALRLAADAAVTGMVNEASWRRLEQLSLTDELTSIPNYRYLRRAVESQIALALRHDEYFTVVMVDVDNLKLYNAAHGHLAGSDVLRRLARLLRENVRTSDVAAKYGGDEFVLVLPHTRPAGGMVMSERIRRRIEESLRGRGGEVLSASFGVAGFPEDGCDFESLVRAADQALFRAKGEGRNSVVCLAATGEIREKAA